MNIRLLGAAFVAKTKTFKNLDIVIDWPIPHLPRIGEIFHADYFTKEDWVADWTWKITLVVWSKDKEDRIFAALHMEGS